MTGLRGAWRWLKTKPLALAAVALVAGGGITGGAVLVSHDGHQAAPDAAVGRAGTTTTGANTAGTLPPCQSASATGCDRSRLPVGNNGSAGCTGKGTATITASPIAVNDIAYIQPMGLEVGGHVTPIDHGYFYVKGALARPATIVPVYAPLDGIVTSVTRTVRAGDAAAGAGSPQRATYDDDAITIEATCTFRVRFSNLLRFDGPLGERVGQLGPNQNSAPDYAVKAGELIGYTGQPTANAIDVWVENDDLTLTGFINPAQYTAAEVWKTGSPALSVGELRAC